MVHYEVTIINSDACGTNSEAQKLKIFIKLLVLGNVPVLLLYQGIEFMPVTLLRTLLPYSGESLLFLSVWRITRSAKSLVIVSTNLDDFSLANRGRFAKFTKLSRYTVCRYYIFLWLKGDHDVINRVVSN